MTNKGILTSPIYDPLRSLMPCVIALLLSACQQTQMVFTPTEAPNLASFETQNTLPKVDAIMPTMDSVYAEEFHEALQLPYHLQRVFGAKVDNIATNRLSLTAVSPKIPFVNPDILQLAFQEKAQALAMASNDPCFETLEIRVTLHSINLSLTCPANINHLYGQLVQFWQPETFTAYSSAPVEIDNIRRRLKLNKHLNAFSGAEIDKVWRDKLLGQTHPYNQAINNETLFDTLTLGQLQQIQLQATMQATMQAEWHLFIPEQYDNKANFDIQNSLSLWPINTKPIYSNQILPPKNPQRTKKIYLIDAPGSVQTQVRLGYALDTQQFSPRQITLSCRSLAALLGRSFSGRLYYDLREKRGLTYGIYGQCTNAPLSSSIKFYGSTAIEHTGAFVVGILDHLALVKTQTASQGEIDTLKTYLIGEDLLIQDNKIQRESHYIHQLATGFTQAEALKLNAELQALSPTRLQQLANGAFREEPLIILRGDADRIIPDLETKLPEWQLEKVKAN
ncbi:insulinase family protein [Shewanella profunda]|uniref:M16 family metallopeptidase n=1 Tax=Shewanella profunda TaxID=254793 RepID=UPI00200BCB95|nr:insulinase family protein [Shewanella profunda]MCL1089905.1 insulinase family protein [Shewanella profunda]